MRPRPASLAALVLAALTAAPAAAGPDAPAIYAQRCAECHGAARLGGIGPALLPENLGRLRKKDAASVIANSRPAVQMPPFADVL
ncbi:MAG: cytochrome c, partial [Rhodospirillales bacterium]|nr:cytochrome c [Rhodospirillales bacterium]